MPGFVLPRAAAVVLAVWMLLTAVQLCVRGSARHQWSPPARCPCCPVLSCKVTVLESPAVATHSPCLCCQLQDLAYTALSSYSVVFGTGMLGFYSPGFSRPMSNTIYCSSEIPAPLPGCFFAVLTQIHWNLSDFVSFPSMFTFQSSVSLEVGDEDTAKPGLILPQFLFKKGELSNNPAGIYLKSTSQGVTFEQEFVWVSCDGFTHQNLDEKPLTV